MLLQSRQICQGFIQIFAQPSTVMKFFVFVSILLFSFLTSHSQDKVIKDKVTPSQKEREELEDANPKEITLPNLKNIKKELQSLPTYSRKWIPVPVVFTDPNVGFNYGAGLGILLYDQEEVIKHVIAPYFHYNEAVGFTGTLRYLYYPTEQERYYYKASKSEHVNEELLAEYINKKILSEKLSINLLGDLWEDGTARFFGIGNDTDENDETNYGHREIKLKGMLGFYLSDYADLAIGGYMRWVNVEEGNIDDVKSLSEMNFSDELTRNEGIIAGILQTNFNILAEIDEELAYLRWHNHIEYGFAMYGENDDFLKYHTNVTSFYQWHEHISIAGKIMYENVKGDHLPFYVLSSLGGSRSFRGNKLGRYYDEKQFSGMIELRWDAFEFAKWGFETHWQIALFYDFGMVMDSNLDLHISKLHHALGLGVRTKFSKEVITRVDVGYGEEGVMIFVDFGYPF